MYTEPQKSQHLVLLFRKQHLDVMFRICYPETRYGAEIMKYVRLCKRTSQAILFVFVFVALSVQLNVPQGRPWKGKAGGRNSSLCLIRQKLPSKDKVLHEKTGIFPSLFVPTEKEFNKKRSGSNNIFMFFSGDRKFFSPWIKLNILTETPSFKLSHINYHSHPRDPPYIF